LFGWDRHAAIEERAKQIARMLTFIKHGMRTKTYEQFTASFSNPGDEPDAMDRYRREANFTMRISSTSWYSAQVSFPHDDSGVAFIALQGGGDDFGVFVTAGIEHDGGSVELHLAFGQKAGRDARAMVRALEAMPGWTRAGEMERALGIDR
jgi:hypothetical protein